MAKEIEHLIKETEDPNKFYKRIDGLDKKCKPLILKWLADLFGYENYPHSFKDQWITWGISDGLLSVSFDLRNEEHRKLLSLIHPRFLGCPQFGTLKIVNEKNFYIDLNCLINVETPDIIGSKLIAKNKQRGGTGGWHSPSDDFYTYDWRVFLSDGTALYYHNQKEVMDMVKNDFTYTHDIQQRAFVKFLNNL